MSHLTRICAGHPVRKFPSALFLLLLAVFPPILGAQTADQGTWRIYYQPMRDRVQMIRAVEKEVGRPIGILLDLQGPKLRVGEFAEGAVYLTKGAEFTLDLDPAPGNAERVRLPHPEILSALKPGNTMLPGDVIVGVNQRRITSAQLLARALRVSGPVALNVVRGESVLAIPIR